MSLQNKKILLGVTGSISAYKACDLVQRLKDAGATVRVVMTYTATQLVHPNTFAALTGYKVSVGAFSGIESGAMEHIDLARWADIYLIAPCSGHTFGELAQGLTGSLISLIYMAYGRPVYLAPAMNTVMLSAGAVQKNLVALQAKGDILLPTGNGILACGEVGYGKLLDVMEITAYLKTHQALKNPLPNLKGKRVLLSLGHTQEKWDDVRFLSNRSSGKTGLALARMLHLLGAKVHLVSGVLDNADASVQTVLPENFTVSSVKTSEEFLTEMLQHQAGMDIIIMAAAIADFVPSEIFSGKRKDSKNTQQIELKSFPNILSELGAKKAAGQILVGFALETEDAMVHAEKKMQERNCDFVVVNDPVMPGPTNKSGFGEDTVMAEILSKENAEKNPKVMKSMSKDDLAFSLLSAVSRQYKN